MNQIQQEQYTGKGGIYQQLTLPISENILIDEHEPVYVANAQLEELDYRKLYQAYSPKGRKSAAEPRIMFKLLVYNNHPSLQFYAREKTSFDFMSRYYRNVKMMPDMALCLKLNMQNTPRKGCILLMRKDLEKTLPEEDASRIRRECDALFGTNVQVSDTVLKGYVSPQDRNETLEQMWKEIGSKELVITDRLHGMLFAALTETPCIVFDSKSPKLRGCYEWLKHLDYITFASTPEQIPTLYAKLKKLTPRYDNTLVCQQMKELEKDILQSAKQNQ